MYLCLVVSICMHSFVSSGLLQVVRLIESMSQIITENVFLFVHFILLELTVIFGWFGYVNQSIFIVYHMFEPKLLILTTYFDMFLIIKIVGILSIIELQIITQVLDLARNAIIFNCETVFVSVFILFDSALKKKKMIVVYWAIDRPQLCLTREREN